MTKLPKRLEKVIEQKAEAHVVGISSRFDAIGMKSDYKKGGTDIAIEVLKEAQKLVEALEKLERIKIDGVTFESQVVVKALSDWNAFVEGE